jgi:hypothetical protein
MILWLVLWFGLFGVLQSLRQHLRLVWGSRFFSFMLFYVSLQCLFNLIWNIFLVSIKENHLFHSYWLCILLAFWFSSLRTFRNWSLNTFIISFIFILIIHNLYTHKRLLRNISFFQCLIYDPFIWSSISFIIVCIYSNSILLTNQFSILL